jgi:signal transduction histidine kinase/CheY-like chemotaxis protein
MIKNKIAHKFITTIVTASLVVLIIAIAMSFKVKSDIARDNYDIIQGNLAIMLLNEINAKKQAGITNAIAVASNAEILLALSENDKDLAYEILKDIEKKYQKFTEFKNIKVHIHTDEVKSFLRSWDREKNGDDLSSFRHTINKVKKTKTPLSAIEIGIAGLTLRSIVPIIDEFGYNGSLEYLQSFDPLVIDFENKGMHFLVLAKKDKLLSVPKQSMVAHNLAISHTYYNKDFFNGFKQVELEKLLNKGYFADDNFFYSVIPIKDFKKEEIGYYIIGEDIKTINRTIDNAIEVVYIFILMLLLLTFITLFVVNLSLKHIVITNLYKVTEGLKSFFDYLNKKKESVERIDINTSDEMGKMAKDINENISTIKHLIEQENHEKWIKEGISKLNNTLSGDSDISSISNKSLKFVCEYLKAGVGALYLFDKEEETLHLYGSYAFIQRNELSNKFKLGEGVVGQVALQKSPIQLENINRTISTITTGTTSEPPLNTYTFPLIYQNEIYGVIELASFNFFNEVQRKFFDQINKIIATTISSSLQNEQVKELLVQSQESNKQLTEQQQLMEEKNHELQEQQAQLEEANTQMQEQQAQLEEANSQMQEQQAQLEEANAQMEEQQVQLKEQNSQLVKSGEELNKKAKDLEESNKYKSEFLANMSHELRTPLNSVILLSSILAQNKKENLSEDDIKKATIINNSGEELLRLINDVLDLSKVEAGRMELVKTTFSSKNFIRSIHDLFETNIENKGLEFIIEDKFNKDITTDEDKLSQVIRNFLSNALKFTEKGHIKFIIEDAPNNHIKLSVEDTGIGIPKDKQELVFKAFMQADGSTSRKYGGTGLGLSITKELVNLMKGDITLSSKEDEGSTFSITIPNLPDKQQNSNPVEIKEEPKKEQKVIIQSSIIDDSRNLKDNDQPFLIIEDNESFALTLKDAINENNEYALIATTGQKGLELAKSYNNIQGILLDLGLPDIDGIEVLKELKTNVNTRRIPVYIISGRESDNQTKFLGAVGFKQKPLSNNDLNSIFNDIHSFNDKKVKDLLIVEDNDIQREAIIEFIGNGTIKSHGVASTKEAIDELHKGIYDAVVVDLTLKDGHGIQICEYIKANELNVPIIVYTGKDLTIEEENEIKKYTDSIVIKSANSQNRLLEEVDMFLHRVKTNNYKEKQYNTKDIDLNGKKVLVADDDMRNTFVLVEILEDHNAEVLTAADGQEALDILEKNPDTSLVLMDIMMPVMDGYEAIEKIRQTQNLKDIPIIAVTAKAMPQDKEKSLKVGANDYLSKPLNLETFVGVIQAWIR